MTQRISDSDDLAAFGYKQQLHRSLGGFSSFAAGFSFISVLTGIFQLFAFGFGFAGGAVWWTWPVVFLGQLCVALCFAELAGQFPLAGSVYQWSKRVTSDFVSWMAGWILIAGLILTVAAVAVSWQVILPQISTSFQFVGSKADAGSYITNDGAKNAIILGIILLTFTTIVNMLGVKVMARINNIGVAAELIGVSLLCLLLFFHAHRGPGVIMNTLGTGQGHSWGYFGAFLIGGIMSAYVLFGFDTASSLGEETNDPRRTAPRAIVRALFAAFATGGLLLLAAMMAVTDIHDEQIGILGLPYIVKQQLGDTLGTIFLIDVAVAISVCCLAVHTGAIRMMFAMARDGRLPFGHRLARVSGRGRVPVVPALFIGLSAMGVLLINLGNKSAFVAITSVAIVLFYCSYLCATGPLLLRRIRGEWPTEDHGDHFSLGRWGLPINLLAVVYGAIVALNVAWPRREVYNFIGSPHWYYQYAAFILVGVVVLSGTIYYFSVMRHRTPEVLAEHRVDIDLNEPRLGEVAP